MKIFDYLEISVMAGKEEFNGDDGIDQLETEGATVHICDDDGRERVIKGDEFLEFANACEGSHLDVEAILAYADNLGLDWDAETVSKAEEDYQGQFDDDAAFAQDMADQIGAIEKGLNWPYTCIDWEAVAKELMHDFFCADGYYFRNS